jgi:hypothetical protein
MKLCIYDLCCKTDGEIFDNEKNHLVAEMTNCPIFSGNLLYNST